MKVISPTVKQLVRGQQRDDSNLYFLKNDPSCFAGQVKDNNKHLGDVPWPTCPRVPKHILLLVYNTDHSS